MKWRGKYRKLRTGLLGINQHCGGLTVKEFSYKSDTCEHCVVWSIKFIATTIVMIEILNQNVMSWKQKILTETKTGNETVLIMSCHYSEMWQFEPTAESTTYAIMSTMKREHNNAFYHSLPLESSLILNNLGFNGI
uniref:Uncharacterized protein n=1 Tax=Glossina austeni TaxID=7395 RepID=A0A1A9VY91_GLOAU